jgi:hypothetical protein
MMIVAGDAGGRNRQPQGSEARIVAAAVGGRSGSISLLVEAFSDLGIDVIVEKLIDRLDDAGLRLDLLRGGFWAQGGERLDFAALESNVNFGNPFRQLDESDILNDVGQQPLAFAVRSIGVGPKLTEVRCHCHQPLMNSFIEDELIVLPGVLALFPSIGQHTEFIVPCCRSHRPRCRRARADLHLPQLARSASGARRARAGAFRLVARVRVRRPAPLFFQPLHADATARLHRFCRRAARAFRSDFRLIASGLATSVETPAFRLIAIVWIRCCI